MDTNEITAVVITWNEQCNISRCLDRLRWLTKVLVIDSGSTDRTLEICQSYSNVKTLTRPFDNFANQVNFGLDQVETDWVLTLDADYLFPESFVQEVAHLLPESSTIGYQVRFNYCVKGTPLRGTLYPPRTVLFRNNGPHYIQDGHGHLLVGDEPCKKLVSKIDHDDRKTLNRWVQSQSKYAKLEAKKLVAAKSNELPLQDQIRKMIWPVVPIILIYTLIIKGTIFDGWKGWFYALQRTYAELLLSLELLQLKIGLDNEPH